MKWKTVHPRKRKDPVCTADIQDGFFSVRVEIYYKPSWFVAAESDQPYRLVIAGHEVECYCELEHAMECAESRVYDHLRGMKNRLEQTNAQNKSILEKIAKWQKQYEEERDR